MNRIAGTIAAIESCGSVMLVDVQVGSQRYSATILGSGEMAVSWNIGTPVTLLFKETEVALAKNLSGMISLRNRFKGVVSAMESGQVLTKVSFVADGEIVTSIITTRSAQAMQIALGDAVEGLVKANEMTLIAQAVS
jgi:molybdate transport system regulatory protein